MSDYQAHPDSSLKLLDDNTLFTAIRFWLHESETTGAREVRQAVGIWGWETVISVQQVSEAVMPEMLEPRCMIEQPGGYIYLRADYQQVARAWRAWRLFYSGRFLNFSQAN